MLATNATQQRTSSRLGTGRARPGKKNKIELGLGELDACHNARTMENELANKVDELRDGEKWETLRGAVNVACLRESVMHGRTDMFIQFVCIELQSKAVVDEALQLLEAVGIKAYNPEGCKIEIHAIPSVNKRSMGTSS